MLQVGHTQKLEYGKDDQDKTPFRKEMLAAQQKGAGGKARKLLILLWVNGAINTPQINFGMPQFIQHTHYLSRIPQVTTHCHYSAFPKVREVRGTNMIEQTTKVEIIMATVYTARV